ncbi:hypothetical protein [Paenibacillus macerans]
MQQTPKMVLFNGGEETGVSLRLQETELLRFLLEAKSALPVKV